MLLLAVSEVLELAFHRGSQQFVRHDRGATQHGFFPLYGDVFHSRKPYPTSPAFYFDMRLSQPRHETPPGADDDEQRTDGGECQHHKADDGGPANAEKCCDAHGFSLSLNMEINVTMFNNTRNGRPGLIAEPPFATPNHSPNTACQPLRQWPAVQFQALPAASEIVVPEAWTSSATHSAVASATASPPM